MKNIETLNDSLKAAFQSEYMFIIIGQSGAGKALVDKYRSLFPKKFWQFWKKSPPYLCLETGQLLREEIPKMSDWNRVRLKERQVAGKLQSWSIASCLWKAKFLKHYKGGPIFVDGSPRSEDEVYEITEFYQNYAKKEIIVFYLQIDDEEADRRMVIRNDELHLAHQPIRQDTATPQARREKLLFFHADVESAIELLAEEEGVWVADIDATQDKETVEYQVFDALAAYVEFNNGIS